MISGVLSPPPHRWRRRARLDERNSVSVKLRAPGGQRGRLGAYSFRIYVSSFDLYFEHNGSVLIVSHLTWSRRSHWKRWRLIVLFSHPMPPGAFLQGACVLISFANRYRARRSVLQFAADITAEQAVLRQATLLDRIVEIVKIHTEQAIMLPFHLSNIEKADHSTQRRLNGFQALEE